MFDENKVNKAIKSVCSNSYFWLMFNQPCCCDKFSQFEYYQVCRSGITAYPDQLFRVKPDKLSSKQYFELCKIMASHGVIDTFNFQYDKLKYIKNRTISDIMYELCKTAILASCGEGYGLVTCYDAIQNKIYPTKNINISDYAKLYLYMALKFPDNTDMTILIDFYNRRLIHEKMINEVLEEIISTAKPEFYDHFTKEYDLWLSRQEWATMLKLVSNRKITTPSEFNILIHKKLKELFERCCPGKTLSSSENIQLVYLQAAITQMEANREIAQAQRTTTIIKSLGKIEEAFNHHISKTKDIVYG